MPGLAVAGDGADRRCSSPGCDARGLQRGGCRVRLIWSGLRASVLAACPAIATSCSIGGGVVEVDRHLAGLAVEQLFVS